MKRFLLENLISWKDKSNRLPLIIKGARQVGKTYLVHQFGTSHFENLHAFNFEMTPNLKEIFSGSLEANYIINQLELRINKKITSRDLIFFDEIQDCPQALTALKYFAEQLPQQPIISAGSLLGITLPESSYPVGKVEYLWMGPFSFEEFLLGINDSKGINILGEAETKLEMSLSSHEHLWCQLKQYYVTGGLPKPIKALSTDINNLPEAFTQVREVQNSLLRDYISDFSKYIQRQNAAHIRAIFENIV